MTELERKAEEELLQKLLDRLTRESGSSLVCSANCSEVEIAFARSCGRMAIIDSIGYVFRTGSVSMKAEMEKAFEAGRMYTITYSEPFPISQGPTYPTFEDYLASKGTKGETE